MAKRIDGKNRKQPNGAASLKSDKLKLDAHERQTEKNRLREQKHLQLKKNEELKVLEYQLREERLKPTCAMLAELSRKKYEHDLMYRDKLDWKHRIQCNGTPNPRVVQELNTYLFVRRQVRHTNDNEKSYVDKCLEIFNIMDTVDDIVDLPLDFNKYKLQCFREARDDLGRLLVDIIYGECYRLLGDYERRMDLIDLETALYQNSCKAFAVGLHAVCHRPRLVTDDRPPPKCDFPECLVAVEVPPQLSQQYMAIMALWLRWDPFTDRMAEFDVSGSPELDTKDLWQYSQNVWSDRERISRELDDQKRLAEKRRWEASMKQKLKAFADVEPVHYPEDLKTYVDGLAEGADYDPESQDQPVEVEHRDPDETEGRDAATVIPTESASAELARTPSQELQKRQLEQMEKISESLKYSEKPNELNPRRYWIIGGAFNVEMWKLPMQPVEHQDGTVVVMLVGPAALQPIDYHEKYEPLQLSFSSTSSEDEETDVKKQNQEALKRLTLINIKLPENVLWFENPKPAMWNEDKKIWTTDYIYDVRFNEEKQTVSFRAGRMGSFGLAVNRYSNFPFQSWEIRPEGMAAAGSGGGGGGGGGGGSSGGGENDVDGTEDNGEEGVSEGGEGSGGRERNGSKGGGVVLSVTAATVLVEFMVRDDLVAMVQLQNATTVAMQDTIGAYHRPDRLVRLLRRGGINLFPEPDARHYVDGRRPTKHAAAERHAYRCMAALSGTHQFTASRWNMHVAADRMVMQMKEIPTAAAAASGGGGPYRMAMVTPERAVLLKCNEVSQAFSEDPLSADARFAPDLYTLAGDVASADSVRAAMAAVDYKTTETLFFLMDKIKFLSYS